MQRERDAREARQLDREIRAQERHYQDARKQKEAADRIQSQIHTQLSQVQKVASSDRTSSTPVLPTKSPRDSVERVLLTDGKIRAQSEEKEKVKFGIYQSRLAGASELSSKTDSTSNTSKVGKYTIQRYNIDI